jgi:hypothetical protein
MVLRSIPTKPVGEVSDRSIFLITNNEYSRARLRPLTQVPALSYAAPHTAMLPYLLRVLIVCASAYTQYRWLYTAVRQVAARR